MKEYLAPMIVIVLVIGVIGGSAYRLHQADKHPHFVYISEITNDEHPHRIWYIPGVKTAFYSCKSEADCQRWIKEAEGLYP